MTPLFIVTNGKVHYRLSLSFDATTILSTRSGRNHKPSERFARSSISARFGRNYRLSSRFLRHRLSARFVRNLNITENFSDTPKKWEGLPHPIPFPYQEY